MVGPDNPTPLWLYNDDGVGHSAGAPGSAGVLENSFVRVHLNQCVVDYSNAEVVVTWALEFKQAFVGQYNVFMLAEHSGAIIGWDQMGTWAINHCGSPTPTRTPTVTSTPPPGGAGIIIFQQGLDKYYGCTDTNLDPWETNRNHDNDGEMIVRANNSFSGLLRFDLSSLPTNAIVTRAELGLYADRWQTLEEPKTSMTVGVYKVMRFWEAAEATWDEAYDGRDWGVAGCNSATADRVATAADEAVIDSVGKWFEWALTALAQSWVENPRSNHGVVLKSFSVQSGGGAFPHLQPRRRSAQAGNRLCHPHRRGLGHADADARAQIHANADLDARAQKDADADADAHAARHGDRHTFHRIHLPLLLKPRR